MSEVKLFAMEVAIVSKKNPKQAFWISMPQVLLTCANPHLRDFLESHFLDEEVKIIQKMATT